MSALSASTGWNGGGSYGRAKDRRKLYVANRRDIRLYNRRTGKGKRYAKPGIWSSERSKAWHGVR